MDKARAYLPAPSRKPRKRNKGKRNTQGQVEYQRLLGHVRLISKYNSKCAVCPVPIKVDDLIWWNPEEKYVLHEKCFKKYFGSNT